MSEQETPNRCLSFADPAVQLAFKKRVGELATYLRNIQDIKDGMKDAVAESAKEYGIDKKNLSRIVRTYYKSNYHTQLEEQRHFEQLYESLIEGTIRDDDDTSAKKIDPLDQ